MIIMKIFVNILSAIIEVMILQSFLSIFGDKKNKKFLFLASIVFVIINVTTLMLIKQHFIFIVCTILSVFAFTCFYKVSLVKRIIATAFIFVFVVIFEILISLLISSLTGLTVENLQNNIIAYLIGISISKLILYGIVRIMKYFIRPKKERVNISVLFLFILLPLTSIFILYALSEYIQLSISIKSQILAFIASFFLIVSNLAIFLVFDYVLKQKEKSSIAEKQIMQYELEKQYHSDIIDKQVEANKTIHDVKNKFYAIKSLLTNDINAAINEIDKMCDKLNGMAALKITGIESLDALLKAKIDMANEIQAKLECNSIMLDSYIFEPIDMCVILGNLLDNSIEACEKIHQGEKFIKVIFMQKEGFLSIIITNTISKSQELSSTIKTSKKDKFLHGYGIENVKEVVKKYNGIMKHGIENKKYIVNLILPTEKK